jgi:hypothetical protein
MTIARVDKTYRLLTDMHLGGRFLAAGSLFCCLDRDDYECRVVLLQNVDDVFVVPLEVFEKSFEEQ